MRVSIASGSFRVITTVGLFWVMNSAGVREHQPLGGVCSLYQMWEGCTIDGNSSLKGVMRWLKWVREGLSKMFSTLDRRSRDLHRLFMSWFKACHPMSPTWGVSGSRPRRRDIPFHLCTHRVCAICLIVLGLTEFSFATTLAAQIELPRFASLRAERVNVRSGPGVRYPITWVFVRRGLPIEITAEFEFWRKVRDQDGSEGWVHRSLISSTRTALVFGAVRPLHGDPSATSPAVLLAEPGVQGELLACQESWCELRIAGRVGWMQRDHLWGVHAQEMFE